MGRKKVEINKIRGENLRMLLNENGMAQKELAEKIGYTKEHISYIINGKRNLREDAAKAIVGLFPPTRFEWLMGYDGYKTETEKALSEFNDWNNEWKVRLNAVRMLAYLSGYEIDLFPDEKEHDIEIALKCVKDGYKIIKDGAIVGYCPIDRFNLLALDIQELAEQRIKSFLREVSDNG